MATTATIRGKIVDELLEIAGLGGTQAPRNVHKYAFLSDDVKEVRALWEATETGGGKVVNGVMLTRTGREDLEPVAGREFAVVHTFVLHFRYGKGHDLKSEETFEAYLDAIMDKLMGNPDVFFVGGLHPQPHAKQVARATARNIKLFDLRIFEADVEFRVVEQTGGSI